MASCSHFRHPWPMLTEPLSAVLSNLFFFILVLPTWYQDCHSRLSTFPSIVEVPLPPIKRVSKICDRTSRILQLAFAFTSASAFAFAAKRVPSPVHGFSFFTKSLLLSRTYLRIRCVCIHKSLTFHDMIKASTVSFSISNIVRLHTRQIQG